MAPGVYLGVVSKSFLLLTVHTVVNLSCDCSKLIVIFNHRLYYVWEKDPRQNVLTTREEDLQGVWSSVVAPDNIPLPYSGQREASSHVVFYKNEVGYDNLVKTCF